MSLEPYPLNNRSPIMAVRYNDLEISDAVSEFEVTTFRRGPGDTAWLKIPLASGLDSEFFARGAPITIRWGLDSEVNLQLIFDGVVRDIIELENALRVELVDYMTLLHAKRITTTLEDENAEAIIRQLTSGMGLAFVLESSGLDVKKFPVFNCTVFDAVTHLAERVKFELGKTMLFWVRDKTLFWQTAKAPTDPVAGFVTGINISNHGGSKRDGYSWLKTGIVPLRHTDTIEFDGVPLVVERIYYRWQRGGRSKVYWKRASD